MNVERPELDKTFVTPSRSASALDGLSPMELADLVLAVFARRAAHAVVLERADDRFVLRVETADGIRSLASVDRPLGEATLARLAVVAELSLESADERIGRLKVSSPTAEAEANLADGPPTEVLVVLRSTPGGLIGELRRIVGRADSRPAPAAAGGPQSDSRIGAYELLGELGRGGMGVVYRAVHVALQKQVAVKMLAAGVADDPELAARFLVEARAACRARDPGIVDVTDFGWLADGRGYLVMELVPWQTLDALIAVGPLERERALKIAMGVTRAVKAASARGVIHRDLKPANIFVEGEAVKVSDFGLARIAVGSGKGSQTGGVLGTPAYISPEQISGRPVDVRADLYSVGCILFEMLTGRLPYVGHSIADTLEKHLSAPLPRVGSVPELTERVVQRALAKDPEQRYRNADELLADLDLALRPPLLSAFTDEGRS